MSYTIIPLGQVGQSGQSSLMPVPTSLAPQQPMQFTTITQQPSQQQSQYPMIIDLSQAYNNSVQPNISQYTPGQYAPAQFNPNQNIQGDQVKATKRVPTQPRVVQPAMTEYEPRNTGCCGKLYGSEEYADDQGMANSDCCGMACGGCCGGCCGGGNEDFIDEYYQKGSRKVEDEIYYEDEDEDVQPPRQPQQQPQMMPQMMPQVMPQMMPQVRPSQNMTPIIMQMPSSNLQPIQLNGNTVIPLSYPQGNVRVLGNVGLPVNSGAYGLTNVQPASNVQATRYVLG